MGLYTSWPFYVSICSVNQIRQKRLSEALGVTLVEVMVGMMVIALVFLSTMATLSIGFRASENARLNGDAQFFLESELETIRSMTWTEVQALKTQYDKNVDANKTTAFTTYSPDSRLSSSISISSRNSRSDQYEILLSVTWADAKGKNHEANMVTLVTRSGVTAS